MTLTGVVTAARSTSPAIAGYEFEAVQESGVVMAALPVVSAPRFQLVPAGSVGSRGAEAVELAAGAGLVLTEEQRMVLHAGLGVRADGSWSAFEVALIEPRQNGKSSALQARILLGLKLGEQIAYTTHRVDSAQETFRGLVALVEASPELAPLLEQGVVRERERGDRAGERWPGGVRHPLEQDRPRLLPRRVDRGRVPHLARRRTRALMPATSARARPPQVWYAGTAVDETVNEHGLVLARLRERGIAGEAIEPRLLRVVRLPARR